MALSYDQAIKNVLAEIHSDPTLYPTEINVKAVKKINKFLDTYLAHVIKEIDTTGKYVTDKDIENAVYNIGKQNELTNLAVRSGQKAVIASEPASPSDIEERIIELLEPHYIVDEPMRKSVKKLTLMKKTKGNHGLHFSSSTVAQKMRKAMKNPKSKATIPTIKNEASIYLAAILEYLTAELLELSGSQLYDGPKEINDRHVYNSIERDDELKELCISIGFKYSAGIPKGKLLN